jgi:drug/metabolite transporter (DMT)-like permease
MAPAAASVPRGIALMVAAMLFVPTLDAITKLLTATLPPLEIAFGRFVAQIVIAGTMALVLGRPQELRLPPRLGGHVLRGLFMAATNFFFVTSLSYMPLTDALAIAFLEPLLLTAASPILLGETIGWRRWTAAAVGFAGSLLVIQPSFAKVGWVVLYPLASAVSFAAYHVMTRKIAGYGTVLTAQWTSGLSGGAGLGLALVLGTATATPGLTAALPNLLEVAALAAVGLIGYAAHSLILRAFALAPAGVLAPFGYLEVVTATALGYAIWGDLPGAMTWAGIGLIVGAGIYSAHREMVRAQDPKVLPRE